MTYPSNVKYFLASVGDCRIKAKRLRWKVKSLEDAATKTTATVTGMPRGGGSDKDATLASLIDARDEYLRMLIETENYEREVLRLIDQVDDPTLRSILRLRYCDGLSIQSTLRVLAEEGFTVSERWCYKLQRSAIDAVKPYYEELRRQHGCTQ